jgi:ubiquinone/menaquinone biosynthesis C-methylase UbiE
LVDHTELPDGAAVADIGAGTGLWTQLLADRGFSVTAVDPNAAMRSQASARPNVRWFDGAFEQTGLPDASQQWVTAAQAFHWADPQRALPEMRRILVSGCHFTVLWNDRHEDSPILQWTRAAIRRHVPEHQSTYRATRDWPEELVSTGDFANVVAHAVEHVLTFSAERFVHLWQSQNRLAVAAGPLRMQRLIDEITAHLCSQGIASVDVRYTYRAFTAQRCDG